MKIINLEVRMIAEDDRKEVLRLAVSDHATVVAQDESGAIWWYANKPEYKNGIWYSWSGPYGHVLGRERPNPRWREAIMEV